MSSEENWLDDISSEAKDAALMFWKVARDTNDPLVRFESLAKGWDRLASDWKPQLGSSARFRDLCSRCPDTAWSDAVSRLLTEVGRPIKNEQAVPSEAVDEFRKAADFYAEHRRRRPARHSDEMLMSRVGRLIWVIRSNSMHGYKTPSGPVGPNERDRLVCQLAGDVLDDLYVKTFGAFP